MNDVIYSGVFFDDVEAARLRAAFPATLANPIENLHVTLRYVARTFWPTYPELYGEAVEVKVLGYGCNGRNEGLRVELSAQGDVLKKMCKDVAKPHITLAIADGAKPVNTVNLEFKPLTEDARITVMGYYGAFMKDGSIKK